MAYVTRHRLMKGLRLLLTSPSLLGQKVYRGLFPTGMAYRKRFAISLREWIAYHEQHVVYEKCRWMGVLAEKNPLDAWIYQEIIYEAKPDVVIEIGSYQGGGTLYLAHLLDLIGRGKVISIDKDRSQFKARHPRIVEVTGDSASPEVVARTAELCEGLRGMVIHDRDHLKESVLRDLRQYSGFVAVGCYLIVEDGIQDIFTPFEPVGGFEEGPLAAVEEFLKENPCFEIDSERERYILTYNPKGFLKRVR